MPVEIAPTTLSTAAPARSLRVDGPGGAPLWSRALPKLAWAAIATGFVLIGGGNLDLNESEAKLGLAAFERVAPYGQVFGGWEPGLWPAQVLTSQFWARAEGGIPSSASVRWPSAIAGLVLGAVLALRLTKLISTRAGLLVSLCWFGGAALIDRSAAGSLDLIAGLGVIGALDRLLAKGSDLAAGAWTALAFLAGGWPPVALILLATIVIGRQVAAPSWRLLAPPAVAFVGWSAWGLAIAPAQVWAAALALPLTQKLDLGLVPTALGLGLPWGPMALGAAWRSVRAEWSDPGRRYVIGWVQVAGACALAGTLVPGLATAAKLPAIAGLAVAAGAVADRAWAGTLRAGPRRWILGVSLASAALWALVVVPVGSYMAAAMPYYMIVFVVLIVVALATAVVAFAAAWTGRTRAALLVTAALAAGLKLARPRTARAAG